MHFQFKYLVILRSHVKNETKRSVQLMLSHIKRLKYFVFSLRGFGCGVRKITIQERKFYIVHTINNSLAHITALRPIQDGSRFSVYFWQWVRRLLCNGAVQRKVANFSCLNCWCWYMLYAWERGESFSEPTELGLWKSGFNPVFKADLRYNFEQGLHLTGPPFYLHWMDIKIPPFSHLFLPHLFKL